MPTTHDCKIYSEIRPEDEIFMQNDSTINGIADIFKVLGDRTRMRIVFTLLLGEKNVCTIADLIQSTHSNTSHQLKVLKDNRVVDYRKQGKEVVYFLADHHIRLLVETCIEHVNHTDCD